MEDEDEHEKDYDPGWWLEICRFNLHHSFTVHPGTKDHRQRWAEEYFIDKLIAETDRFLGEPCEVEVFDIFGLTSRNAGVLASVMGKTLKESPKFLGKTVDLSIQTLKPNIQVVFRLRVSLVGPESINSE